MQVQCVLCDRIDDLDDNSIKAKRLRNRLSHMYLCESCYKRVEDNTLKRHASGKFKLYHSKDEHVDEHK